MSKFRFSVGPWNVHEGEDAFGPAVRKSIPFEDKVKKFKEIGISAVQFHDDDAVPDMNNLSEDQIKSRAKDVKSLLDEYGLEAEFVAPRLWMDPHTSDGGFTSNSKEDRDFAFWRAQRSVDIARTLGCDRIVLWLAREGTLCQESKDPVVGMERLVAGIDSILNYDPTIRVLIEPKPNEPIDRSFCPTIGHVIALARLTAAPDRVGGLIESAHAILAGLDPAVEMGFALANKKLWGVHLNDQNGMRYDQDKSFGAENLRQAFNQVMVLKNHGYGHNGEYIGLDVKTMRTQKIEVCYKHIENSMAVFKLLEKKVETFDIAKRDKLIKARDYEALDYYTISHLLGVE
ncbi:TIM barrel protein [Pleomorphochaeta sp. DL1XJH-081]|uniref:TIM barrel protein n=1 Tax=Pleomorphochaeta sp. DL1XJH-081 TaxID=3409690 RepID=UPI003BB665BA